MQKFFLIFILFASTMFAQNQTVLSNHKAGTSKAVLVYLIDTGLNKNFTSIQSKSVELTDDDKILIYEKYRKKSLVGYTLLNWVVPGLGSYLQRDYFGGMILTATYLLGYGTVLLGMNFPGKPNFEDYATEQYPLHTLNNDYVGDRYIVKNPDYIKAKNSYDNRAKITEIAGYTIYVSAFIFSVVEVLSFSSKYNDKLGKALNMNNSGVEINFNFVPDSASFVCNTRF